MANTVRNYDNSYDYGAAIHNHKSKQLNKYRKIMGSIFIIAFFFCALYAARPGRKLDIYCYVDNCQCNFICTEQRTQT
jgi:hypothetical protein